MLFSRIFFPFRFFGHGLGLFLLFAGIMGCIPPEDKPIEGVRVDLNDPISHRIYDHQNDRNQDSLLYYLREENPSYRYLAARAFASFPEISDSVIAALSSLLREQNELIRSAAAFALGQSGSAGAADSLTLAFDGTGRYRTFNSTLLAAVGKTGDKKKHQFISGISTYTN